MPVQRWKRTMKKSRKSLKEMRTRRRAGTKALEHVKRLKKEILESNSRIKSLEALKKKLEGYTSDFDRSMHELSKRTGLKRITFSKTRARLAVGRKVTVGEFIKQLNAEINAYKEFVEKAKAELRTVKEEAKP